VTKNERPLFFNSSSKKKKNLIHEICNASALSLYNTSGVRAINDFWMTIICVHNYDRVFIIVLLNKHIIYSYELVNVTKLQMWFFGEWEKHGSMATLRWYDNYILIIFLAS